MYCIYNSNSNTILYIYAIIYSICDCLCNVIFSFFPQPLNLATFVKMMVGKDAKKGNV